MDKIKWTTLILLLFLGYLFYSAFTTIQNSALKRSLLSQQQETAVYEAVNVSSPRKPIVIAPVQPKNPEPKVEEPPQPSPSLDQGAELIDHQLDEKIEDGNKVVLCYTQLLHCQSKDIMFDYPSPRNPWSEISDWTEVECITNKRFCSNSNPQELTEEVRQQIMEYYFQKNQEKMPQQEEQQQQYSNEEEWRSKQSPEYHQEYPEAPYPNYDNQDEQYQ